MSVCRLRRVLLPFGLVLGLVACGSQDGDVPVGGSIVIAPSALTITTAKTGSVDCTTPVIIQRQVIISTFDQSGLPRGKADIVLFIDFADLGITGIGAIGVGAVKTSTEEDGNKTVVIFLNVTENCEYQGSLTVSSGSIVTDMTFDVSN